MQPSLYVMLQDRLSTGGSFNLCDTLARGFPMLYASRGFVDLFGYSAAECAGVPCGHLVGIPSILEHDPDLRGLASSAGMAPHAVKKSLELLRQHAKQEVDRIMGNSGECMAHSVLVNRRKGGDLFVCEVIMVVQVHAALGWKFAVGLQSDITGDISIRTLLAAALDGTYAALHEARDTPVRSRLASLSMASAPVSHFLQDKCSELWMVFLNTMLDQGNHAAPTEPACAQLPGAKIPAAVDARPAPIAAVRRSTACELVGRWHGTVDKALGGLEQILDFSDDHSSMRVEIQGQVTHGSFQLDDAYSPCHLDLCRRPPANAMWVPEDPVPYIVKVEGNVLHLCRPYPGEERPLEFSGPGYVRMTRVNVLPPSG